ncbi:cellulase [Geosmithia morbida]|uniref:Glucanase n=1 Tax=Geosmithia morbida TaxID=1094350 RepID=A0A9P4Z593_9HYPO|nr:cellulase [Geosmithia morbida]KAF4126929.1 cellulase [Geosmithia morbida]
MRSVTGLTGAALISIAAAQHIGKNPELHPKLSTWECSWQDGCREKKTSVVLDALAHPVRQVDHPQYNCGDWGSKPNETACPDEKTCHDNCVMEGISDYEQVGVTTDGSSIRLDMLSDNGTLYNPRVYLLSEGETEYEMLSLAGKEFTFDVDVSKLPCGMNGAVYLSEMPSDGGMGGLNEAGAYYGTGYCDAQCYTTPFISGKPNIKGRGACCNEMDIWEANSRASNIASHPCNRTGLFECEGDECGKQGSCDKIGCTYNPYKLGNRDSYGRGWRKALDTTRPFTVISQYPLNDDGSLHSYRRSYIQDGRFIPMGEVRFDNLPKVNYLTEELCEATKADKYLDLGGHKAMGEAMDRGMVLALSIWWDDQDHLQWLDGAPSGPCNETEGMPENIRKNHPGTEVTFRNIRWGDLGSTFSLGLGNCTVRDGGDEANLPLVSVPDRRRGVRQVEHGRHVHEHVHGHAHGHVHGIGHAHGHAHDLFRAPSGLL